MPPMTPTPRIPAALAPSPSPTLAVVDMGSNSFRLELGRVEGRQIFRLDTWRETLRMGASMDERGRIRAPFQQAALACLARFAERLRGLHPSAVRAVATNTFRIAANAQHFLARAEKTLGFRIDVISGHEEARLIYLGVAHLLPASDAPRLVVDIGGGSTEFIIGDGFDTLQLESLGIGCVSVSQRFFGGGGLSAAAFAAAGTDASAEIEAIARDFDRKRWHDAFASSGTALALAAILEQNGMSSGGITQEGLRALRARMIRAGHITQLRLASLKPDRAPVLAGGLAIMLAALAELRVERINPVGGALRLGVMVDMLGRGEARDIRVVTIEQFADRYRVDIDHARRVAATARALYAMAAAKPLAESLQRIEWAGLLHEIGWTVSHQGFHRHGAYILSNADMPGFSAREQRALAALVLACRGGLAKAEALLDDADVRAQVVALRLAVLLHHARRPIDMPRIDLVVRETVRWRIARTWLAKHPLTLHLIERERDEWAALGYPWRAMPVARSGAASVRRAARQ
jgi:exopolyphosphatase/guanosine-5'-triphosphate,3'-diphosphate pyrophosphatase